MTSALGDTRASDMRTMLQMAKRTGRTDFNVADYARRINENIYGTADTKGLEALRDTLRKRKGDKTFSIDDILDSDVKDLGLSTEELAEFGGKIANTRQLKNNIKKMTDDLKAMYGQAFEGLKDVFGLNKSFAQITQHLKSAGIDISRMDQESMMDTMNYLRNETLLGGATGRARAINSFRRVEAFARQTGLRTHLMNTEDFAMIDSEAMRQALDKDGAFRGGYYTADKNEAIVNLQQRALGTMRDPRAKVMAAARYHLKTEAINQLDFKNIEGGADFVKALYSDDPTKMFDVLRNNRNILKDVNTMFKAKGIADARMLSNEIFTKYAKGQHATALVSADSHGTARDLLTRSFIGVMSKDEIGELHDKLIGTASTEEGLAKIRETLTAKLGDSPEANEQINRLTRGWNLRTRGVDYWRLFTDAPVKDQEGNYLKRGPEAKDDGEKPLEEKPAGGKGEEGKKSAATGEVTIANRVDLTANTLNEFASRLLPTLKKIAENTDGWI